MTTMMDRPNRPDANTPSPQHLPSTVLDVMAGIANAHNEREAREIVEAFKDRLKRDMEFLSHIEDYLFGMEPMEEAPEVVEEAAPVPTHATRVGRHKELTKVVRALTHDLITQGVSPIRVEDVINYATQQGYQFPMERPATYVGRVFSAIPELRKVEPGVYEVVPISHPPQPPSIPTVEAGRG